MPYNPGVQDISGQLRAQGLAGGGRSFAQGMSAGIAKWEKNKEEDKMMQGVIKSAEMMAKGFGEVAGSIDPKLGAAVEKMRETMSDPNMSTRERAMAAESFTKGIGNLMNTGMAGMQLKAQQEQEKQVAMAREAERQQSMAREQRQRMISEVGNMLALGQSLPGQVPQDVYNEATVLAAKLRKDTQMTTRGVDAKGNPTEITDTLGQGTSVSPINKPMRPVLSPEEESDKIDATESARRGNAMFANVTDKVDSHYTTLEQSKRARALIASGAQQGRGAETIVEVKKFVNTFAPGTFKTEGEEALKGTYADMAVSAAARLKGQGQVTENERKMLSDTVAKFGNTPEGAKAIMDYMDAVAKREIAFAEHLSEAEAKGEKIRTPMRLKFMKENPLDGFMEAAPQVARVGRFEIVEVK